MREALGSTRSTALDQVESTCNPRDRWSHKFKARLSYITRPSKSQNQNKTNQTQKPLNQQKALQTFCDGICSCNSTFFIAFSKAAHRDWLCSSVTSLFVQLGCPPGRRHTIATIASASGQTLFLLRESQLSVVTESLRWNN